MTLRLHPDRIVAGSSSPLLAIASRWERVRLGDVADVINGAAFSSSHFNSEGRGEPLVRIRDVGGDRAQVHYDGTYEERHVLKHGDLLVGMDGDFRIAPWGGGRALLNQRVCRLVVMDDRYCERFLLHVLQPYLDAVHAVTSSVTVKHLSSRTIQDLPIPLPPRAEQERIIAAIEEHLSRLDAAEAAVRSAECRLNSMRRSIIEEITRGDWRRRPLGDVLLSLRNGCFVSRPKADPPGLPILRISAVRPLALNSSDVRYAPDSLDRPPDFQVRPGDVLFTRYSGNPDYVGACAVVPAEANGLLHPDKLIRGVPDTSVVLPGWIALVAAGSVGRHEIEQRLKTTAGQVGIAGAQLKSVPIPVPSLGEQAERLARWERAHDAMGRVQSEVDVCLRRAERARRSILTAAFSGQLVPQDPDDEPASVLLERIRSERAASTPPKRTRKVKAS
jgi:type I restriction enzyme S subunit